MARPTLSSSVHAAAGFQRREESNQAEAGSRDRHDGSPGPYTYKAVSISARIQALAQGYFSHLVEF
jgi:hypothetical protein